MIINTRADLEALRGSPTYAAALGQLKSSMTPRQDKAVYPAGYGQPGYEGETVAATVGLLRAADAGGGLDCYLAEKPQDVPTIMTADHEPCAVGEQRCRHASQKSQAKAEFVFSGKRSSSQ